MSRTASRVALMLGVVAALLAALLAGPAADRARADGQPWGVDVASYQHPNGAGIDWGAVHRSGAAFGIVKATEGTGYTNPYFASDWAGIRNAGLVRGAYAFARPALPLSTAADQAQRFVQVVGTTRESGDLPPVLDLEVNGGLTPAQLAQWTQTWLTTAEALTGRVPVIYTGQYFWRDDVASGGFTNYPLWLAAYQDTSPPAPYAGGWGSWTLWQYTSSASVAGIPGRADASRFAGSAAQLAAFADGRDTLISRAYAALGGPSGVLGGALGPEVAIPGGFGQTFAGGALVQVGTTVQAVWGATGVRYVQLGAWNSGLGVPTASTGRTPAGDVSTFAGGDITAQAGSPAYVVAGAVLGRYLAAGGIFGALGWATGDAVAVGHETQAGDLVPVTGGLDQAFTGGHVLSSTKSGAHVVSGPILALYESLGGGGSVLGMPTGEQYAGALGPEVDFQLGSIEYATALGRALVV